MVWAGTGEPHIRSNVTVGDGVYLSTDGGENWQNMGLEATGRISRIVIHPTNPTVVYVAALGHAHGPQPERGIYRTTAGGSTWEHVLFSDEDTGASSLIMDPNNPAVLFAGMWTVEFNAWGRSSGGPGSGVFMSRDGGTSWTKLQGNGLPRLDVGKVDVCMSQADSRRVYVSFNDGDEWQVLTNNMPAAPVYGLAVQEHFGDLAVGTYGRGFWILDDISPLRQLTDEVRSSDAHLFAPRAAYRFNARTSPQSPAAYLNYWLSEETAGSPVEVRISDSDGNLVRTMRGSSQAGINRVFWNFRGEASTPFRNRTLLFADWIDLGTERIRITNGMSLRHAPGTYTVTLDVGGQEYSQQLTVLKDPDSEGTQADIEAQLALLAEIQADYESAAEAVNRIEWLRRQLLDLSEVLEGQGNADDLVSGANELGAALISVEEEIMQIRLTDSSDP